MTLSSLIGNTSLNLSFILYLIVYVPQIIHNRAQKNIAQLSISLHFLLYISYFFDLCYGFSCGLPWQYKTVSVIGCCLLVIQQLQLLRFFKHTQEISFFTYHTIFLLSSITLMGLFFLKPALQYAPVIVTSFGIIARGCGLIYCLPQLIKNQRTRATQAISLHFLSLNLTVSILDTLSAWCLHWGWPNKIAAPITILMMLSLLWQRKIYASPSIVVLLNPLQGKI